MSHNIEQNHSQTEEQSGSHEVTLYAEQIFEIGNFKITNSLFSSWIAMIILVILFYFIGKKVRKIPSGIQNIFEVILEKALELADSISGDRKKSEKFVPIVLALFLFILANNWLGLLPGMGTIGFFGNQEGHSVFIPILRGGTADLNATLALSLFAVIISHVFGVIIVGIWDHFNKFINIKAFLEIPQKIKNDKAIILINPIKAFVGLVEIIGEMAKVASLSFRLFGNIFAGEVLLASMMALFAYILPLPFIFLEILVGLIQALIFAMLALVYFSVASEKHEEH